MSEYEELTDKVLRDRVIAERYAKWADNIFVGGSQDKSIIENIKEVCKRIKQSDLRAALRKTLMGIKETTVMRLHWRTGISSPSVYKSNPLALCERPDSERTEELLGRSQISLKVSPMYGHHLSVFGLIVLQYNEWKGEDCLD